MPAKNRLIYLALGGAGDLAAGSLEYRMRRCKHHHIRWQAQQVTGYGRNHFFQFVGRVALGFPRFRQHDKLLQP